ncbi:unnamed protein product [Hermetia illucens]|uniref:Gustatory receptor n=1 Tax=Hermetia illucens TaxID=343691 RepID=A0A7R8YLR8_HERIL|nr:unnamed protein product [Hermetia illucens]
MNTSRALRVANGVFILWGYQLHAYDRKAKDFRISVLSVIFFLGYLAWYTACVCKYFFDDAFILVLLEGVSPFLYDCLRIHLLFGIKITVLMLIEAKSIAKASTHLCQAFGNSSSTRFTLTELVIYFILFINPLLNIVLGIYDVSMLRPKHFHADRIMILSAVYLPHFSLACALKYLCIVIWLITQDLITLLVDLQLVLMRSDSKSLVSMITIEEPISMTAFEMTPRQQHDPCPLDRSIDLNRILGRVKTIQLISIEVNRVIQKQLNALVIISALVFIEASYAFMYYDLVWNEVLIVECLWEESESQTRTGL